MEKDSKEKAEILTKAKALAKKKQEALQNRIVVSKGGAYDVLMNATKQIKASREKPSVVVFLGTKEEEHNLRKKNPDMKIVRFD